MCIVMLQELAVYAAPLRRMLSSAEHFRDDTTGTAEQHPTRYELGALPLHL